MRTWEDPWRPKKKIPWRRLRALLLVLGRVAIAKPQMNTDEHRWCFGAGLRSSAFICGSILLAALPFVSGCVPMARANKPVVPEPVKVVIPPPKIADGSLWQEDTPASASLTSDIKARTKGDIVTVLVVENVDASRERKTATSKNQATEAKVSDVTVPYAGAWLGPAATALYGKRDANVSLASKRSFDGGGTITDTAVVKATVTTQVVEVLPNGNLLLMGSKEVKVAGEAQVVTLSGIARPKDISPDNVLYSNNLAEARIHISGSGPLDDAQRRTLVTRLFDWMTFFEQGRQGTADARRSTPMVVFKRPALIRLCLWLLRHCGDVGVECDGGRGAGRADPSPNPLPQGEGGRAGETPAAPDDGGVRIKDVAEIFGVRENQLVGQGLIVGLDGCGDKTGTLSPQALSNFLSRQGLNIPAAQLKPKNIAVVAVMAQLPPFVRKGSKLDVQVSSLGDATSLQGGVLIQTPLQGADGRVYAVAQGAISIGGYNASTGGEGGATVQKNHALTGRIPNGALVEREVETTFAHDGIVRVLLRKPDFTTAQRMAMAIDKRWPNSARALDPFTVEFRLPGPQTPSPSPLPQGEGGRTVVTPVAPPDPMTVVAELESLRFVPDVRARVVINERTGTIVAGAQVRLMPTVLSHGSLYITIKHNPVISQPHPLSKNGKTVVTDDAQVSDLEESASMTVLSPGPMLGDLAAALNALKVKPRDIIAIFQALKEAGALNAELIIM